MLFEENLTIVANWKMNPNSYAAAKELFNLYVANINLDQINLIIAPPVIYLEPLIRLMVNNKVKVAWSAQTISSEHQGAFTGQISANMLQNVGCKYTIIGHSECRKYYRETNYQIAKKFLIALQYNLIPIVCIGETKEHFEKGELAVKRFLNKQLQAIVQKISNISANPIEFFIAYEPIWAIGSGISADLEYINQICEYISSKINYLVAAKHNIKILYGGSVHVGNCSSILQLPNIAGALIGGASLDFEQFSKICHYNQELAER